ncbi:MAG TPA: 2-dehydro-3-deoxyphosphogluconate aldolase, partial [Xanthomonadaceae bacterium]|nr:2-dehydro-3-deoxyphosphogluconate aldolase [Xanthomonadaceae bacterium]
EFLAQPNVVCIGGSWMVPGNWVGDGDWTKIRETSAKAAAIVRQARGG